MPEKTVTREDLSKEFADYYPEIVRTYFRPAMNAEGALWLGNRFGVQYYEPTSDRSLSELLDALANKFGEIAVEDREELEKLRDREDNEEEDLTHLRGKVDEKDAEIVTLTDRIAFLESAMRARDPLEAETGIPVVEPLKKRGRPRKVAVVAVVAVVAPPPPPPAYFPPPPPPPYVP